MTESLDAVELAGWRAYVESSQLLLTRLEEDLRADSGLSFADYHVLVLLSEAPGQRLRMGELASRLVFSPSRLTYQISAMQRRGLVARQSCPDDRRGQERTWPPSART
jgi:DNA-binding MarR family transcriptional regulator